ncbi:MAG: hypothetical protein ACI4W6_02410 [Acutalibacteraceae bacterium]
MKIAKKLVAVLLTLIMAFSSVSTTVFALSETEEQAVTALENDIMNFTGVVDIASPTAEDLEAYNALVNSFAALTEEQKNEMELEAFDKLLHLVCAREEFLILEEDPDNWSSFDGAYYAADELLGFPSFMAEALDLNLIVNDWYNELDDKIAAFESASPAARIYSGLIDYDDWYYEVYGLYFYTEYPFLGATRLASYIAEAVAEEMPFDKTAPEKVNAVSPSDYPEGVNDPAYIEALAKYNEYLKANSEYNAEKVRHDGEVAIESMNRVAAIAPEYAPIVSFASKAVNTLEGFNPDAPDYTAINEVISAYEGLSDFQKLCIDTWDENLTAESFETLAAFTVRKYTAKDILAWADSMLRFDTVSKFTEAVNAVQMPYTAEKTEQLKALYSAIPSELSVYIDTAVLKKYNTVLISVEPDLSVYKETKIDVSEADAEKVGKYICEAIMMLLEEKLPQGGLNELVGQKLYTNSMVGSIAKLLLPLLGEVHSGLGASPALLAKKLTEEKFSGAVEVLYSVCEKNSYGGYVNNMEDWNKEMVFDSGDWGFEDGDREGFLDAVAAIFRGPSLLFLAITFENTESDGNIVYNAYENLIPIFEVLDLRGVISSAEYTANVKAAEANGLDNDARIRQILVPIANLIDDFAAAPEETLFNLLPKIAYLIDSGLLDTQLHKITNGIKFATIPEYSMTTQSIFDMVAPKLENITVGETTVCIKLSQERFSGFVSDLAGCGTAVKKDSVSATNLLRLGIEPKYGKTVAVIFNYIANELSDEENAAAVEALINSLSLDSFGKAAVKLLLNFLTKTPSVFTFKLLRVVLPFVLLLLRVSKFFSAMKSIA